MVVLSVALCTKQGKALMSRQFVDMPRLRVESLLSAFPKLLGTGRDQKQSSAAKRQHTYIETENVRYIFQPLEETYLVVVTNKSSNIVEDLQTLRLIAKVVPEYCGGVVMEQTVLDNAFDLVFAFDEVISLGYRETVSMQQIRVNLEMDSHEEKLHDMIQKSKEAEARRKAKENAKKLREERRRREKAGIGSSSAPGGISSDSYAGSYGGNSGGGYGGQSGAGAGGAGGGGSSSGSSSSRSSGRPSASASRSSQAPKAGGMRLGGTKKKSTTFLGGMSKASSGATGLSAELEDATEAAAPQADAHVTITEDLTVSMKQDMSIDQMTVKGVLVLTCHNSDMLKLALQLDPDAMEAGASSGFQFKVNPNMHKAAFNENRELRLKNPSRSFSEGKPVKIMQWRMSTKDESRVPLTFNVWPEAQGGGAITVTVEYTLENTDLMLHDTVLRIPLGTTSDAPEIQSIEFGSHRHNSRQGFLEWGIPLINEENSSGSLEFTIAGDDEEAFFPCEVSFTARETMAGVQLVSVGVSDGDEHEVSFTSSSSLRVDSYEIAFE